MQSGLRIVPMKSLNFMLYNEEVVLSEVNQSNSSMVSKVVFQFLTIWTLSFGNKRVRG